MATKKELDILSRLYESIEGKGGIKDDVAIIKEQIIEQNHNVSETNIKLAKTEEIAKDAHKQSSGNRKLILLLAIAGIGGLAAILAQVV